MAALPESADSRAIDLRKISAEDLAPVLEEEAAVWKAGLDWDLRPSTDLVRRFVKATVRSWDETKKNPEAAVDATMKVKPDLNRASQLDQLKVDIELMDSANSKGRIGWGDRKDWDQTIALLKQYRDVATDKPWTAFHTNEFLPK